MAGAHGLHAQRSRGCRHDEIPLNLDAGSARRLCRELSHHEDRTHEREGQERSLDPFCVAACLVLLGNLRVIHAIAGDAWTDTQANILGPARPGFASGHSLAEFGEWSTLAAVILLTVVLLMRGVVRRGPAIAALVTSLVVPAHLIPGAGLFVLAGDVCFQRARRLKDPPEPAAGLSGTSMPSP